MSDTQPKVSVISPVYNVETWLPDCIESLLAQTLTAWEAVFVIDGATDKSAAVIERYAAKDPRVRVLYQKNAGQGAARNRGAEAARGDYLFFLDPDDAIPPNALESMVRRAEEANADIVLGDFHTFNDGDKIAFEDAKASAYYREKFSDLPEVFSREDVKDFEFFYNSIYFMVVWTKLFRADLWHANNVKAPTGLLMGEDFMTVKKMCFVSKRIVTVDDIVIYYRKRRKSATTKRSVKAFDIFKSYAYVSDMYKKMGLSKREWTYLHRAYFHWYFQHLESFTPYCYWHKFYNAMVQSVQTWDLDSFDPEAISPEQLQQLRSFRDSSLFKFFRLSVTSTVWIWIKVWTVKALRFIKRIMPESLLRVCVAILKWTCKKIGPCLVRDYLEKVQRLLSSSGQAN